MPRYFRRHLMLRREYAEKLLTGEKRATIRLGKVIPKYFDIIIHSGGRPICKATITGVSYKKVSELTDEDARKDGFRDKRELIKELKKVYGNIRDDDLVTIIELKVTQRLDNLVAEDPYLGLEPHDIARLAMRYLRKEFAGEERKILEELAKGKSIREVAKGLTGDLTKRWLVRRVLRKALNTLISRGLIKVSKHEH